MLPPCVSALRASAFGAVLALLFTTAANAEQGFGANTPGGTGKPVYRVTNLSNAGPGSLRDAVSAGNRYVVFDVSGEIHLSSEIKVLGAYLTVDGTSAPHPGITVRNAGIDIDGKNADVHDIVIRGIRIRDVGVAGNDGIAIEWGAHHVLIDHVSIDGCGDGNLDITRNAHDVTVAWSVLSGCAKNSLIKYESQRVTLHHNVLALSAWRNPWISYSTEFASNLSPDTMVDMRNNLIWGWGDTGGGTGVECGAKANLVNNYFSSPDAIASRQANAIIMKTSCASGGYGGHAFIRGNVSGDSLSSDLNAVGNQSAPFAAPPVDTHDACTAARDVLAGAGAEPLDALDLGTLSSIDLASCGANPSPTPTLRATATRPAATATPVFQPTSTRPPGPTPTPSRPPTATPTVQLTPPPTATSSPTVKPTATVAVPASYATAVLLVTSSTDDAEELSDGAVKTSYSPLRIGDTRPFTAFRFSGAPIPRGATIVAAKLRTHVVAKGTSTVALTYSAEKTAHSSGFTQAVRSLSSRPKTTSAVVDVPAPWSIGSIAESPNLAAIVQEVVGQSTWTPGNAITLFVANAGSASLRQVASFEGGAANAASLVVQWRR